MTKPEGSGGTGTPVPGKQDGFPERQHLLEQTSLMLDEYFARGMSRGLKDPETDQEVTEKK